jgi:hypothetical protein
MSANCITTVLVRSLTMFALACKDIWVMLWLALWLPIETDNSNTRVLVLVNPSCLPASLNATLGQEESTSLALSLGSCISKGKTKSQLQLSKLTDPKVVWSQLAFNVIAKPMGQWPSIHNISESGWYLFHTRCGNHPPWLIACCLTRACNWLYVSSLLIAVTPLSWV